MEEKVQTLGLMVPIEGKDVVIIEPLNMFNMIAERLVMSTDAAIEDVRLCRIPNKSEMDYVEGMITGIKSLLDSIKSHMEFDSDFRAAIIRGNCLESRIVKRLKIVVESVDSLTETLAGYIELYSNEHSDVHKFYSMMDESHAWFADVKVITDGDIKYIGGVGDIQSFLLKSRAFLDKTKPMYSTVPKDQSGNVRLKEMNKHWNRLNHVTVMLSDAVDAYIYITDGGDGNEVEWW